MLRVLLVGLVVAGALSGCGGSTSADGSDDLSLGEAFCNDLRAGMAPMTILGSSVRDGTYTPQKAADLAYGWAANGCPEQLQSNEPLRTYLRNWNINPDA